MHIVWITLVCVTINKVTVGTWSVIDGRVADVGVTGQMLQRSGYDRDEQADIAEQLHQLANAQQEEDDWSD